MLSLDQLRIGQRAVIESLAGEPALMQRLLELGLFDGEEIEILAVAPLGDPIEILCGNSRLSLRRLAWIVPLQQRTGDQERWLRSEEPSRLPAIIGERST